MDMDVVYAGDADFTVQTCGFRGGLNQLVVSGTGKHHIFGMIYLPFLLFNR